jgi:hypothetical protein
MPPLAPPRVAEGASDDETTMKPMHNASYR